MKSDCTELSRACHIGLTDFCSMDTRAEAGAKRAAEAGREHRDLHGLIDELDALRELMVEVESRVLSRLDGLDPMALDSARNLAHWLAIRAFDLQRIEGRLAQVGLAWPARAGPQPLASVDRLRAILQQLAGIAPEFVVEPVREHEPADTRRGRAEALFGALPGRPRAPIMVTLPRAAAVDDALVGRLLLGGMDIARLDFSQDSADECAALAARLRRVAASTGRAVKVMMELAGPRLRTGPISAGPVVLKLKPVRDALGSVVAPVRLGLRAAGAQAAVPGAMAHAGVDATWLAALEIADPIDFVDARGTTRRLTVLGRCDQGVLVEGTRTIYLTPETRFRLQSRGQDATETTLCDLPVMEGRLLLRRGDTLRLVRHGLGHEASDGSARKRVAVATVACTVPETLDALRKGERVWFDRARIGGVVRRVTPKGVEVEITEAAEDGSWLGGDKRINLPDTVLDLPALTPRDIEDLAVVARHADLVGLSFTQRAADVKRLRHHLHRLGAGEIGVVLRLETRRGFEQLPQVLFAALACRAAAVLVARDDLAVECGFERVAERQEEIVAACEAARVPLVWAMQGPESRTRAGLLSLAEVTDAALDVGAACVVLDKGPRLLDALCVLDRALLRTRSEPVALNPPVPASAAWDGVGSGPAKVQLKRSPKAAMPAGARGRPERAEALRTSR